MAAASAAELTCVYGFAHWSAIFLPPVSGWLSACVIRRVSRDSNSL